MCWKSGAVCDWWKDKNEKLARVMIGEDKVVKTARRWKIIPMRGEE